MQGAAVLAVDFRPERISFGLCIVAGYGGVPSDRISGVRHSYRRRRQSI
jgi:hypothetical protein